MEDFIFFLRWKEAKRCIWSGTDSGILEFSENVIIESLSASLRPCGNDTTCDVILREIGISFLFFFVVSF